jgi:amino acid adenylation domain-containing protein
LQQKATAIRRKQHMDGMTAMETQSTAGYFLSPQQSQLWLLQQRADTPFVSQLAILIEGPLDQSQLHTALRQAVARHEILRTVYRRPAGMKTPFQIILEGAEASWTVASSPASANAANAADEVLRVHAREPFDFEQGPLLRATLLECTPQQSVFVLTTPTLCADSASLAILWSEILAFYAGTSDSLNSEPLRYVQFAQWQSELLESTDEAATEGKTFWRQRAESCEQQIEIPYESKTSTGSTPSRLEVPIDPETLQGIQSLASGSNSSVSDVLLAAWQSLLFRITGKSRLAVGVNCPGREYEELGDAIGLIAKVLPVHARFEGNPRFDEIVAQAKSAFADAVGYQEYLDLTEAFADDAAIAFSYTSLPAPQRADDLSYSILRQENRLDSAKLRLDCVENAGRLELQFNFAPSRYRQSDIEALSHFFVTLVTAAIANPQQEVARLALLSKAEIDTQIYDWNRTESLYPHETIHSLIEQQAEKTPDRLAVRFGSEALTYTDFNRRSNQLAHHLRKLGVVPNALVGVCLDRSADMMIAVLAILKAGGAYVSVSGDHPKPRLEQQLQGVVALITEQKLASLLPDHFGQGSAAPVLLLDAEAQRWADEPATNLNGTAAPEDLAYVIYTSGSTGIPKGVGVRHRNLVNYSWSIAQLLHLADNANGLQFATVTTLGADLGNTCIYPALISGGTLHVVSYEIATDAEQMARYQAQYPIDVLKIVPSHLAALLHASISAEVLPGRFLITGGETLTKALVEEIQARAPGCQIINHYGPTETTVGSLVQPLTGFDLEHNRAATIPIGRPLSNTQVYVLDGLLQPVPEGVTGDLYISGAGVSAGYLGQPKLTEERFLPNPFVPDTSMYRTGDLVRQIPGAGGVIEFLGRADDQVKIRGFRIELGEIEGAILDHPDVKQSVVLAREGDGSGQKALVAYVVVAGGSQGIGEDLRQQLKEQLPDYMIPSAIILLDRLPLTPNGKIDRKALPDPETASVRKPWVEPSTPTERTIARIWEEVLHHKQVSSDDNFFEIGGHSLMATQVISRIRQQFSIEIALRTIFEVPVLKSLAQAVDASKTSNAPAVGPIRRVARAAYQSSVSVSAKPPTS